MIGVKTQTRGTTINHLIVIIPSWTKHHKIKVNWEHPSILWKEGIIEERNSTVLKMMKIYNKEKLRNGGEGTSSVTTNIWFPGRCMVVHRWFH